MIEDTIFAPMTGIGRSAITALRISGARASAVAAAMCGGCPPPRRASLRSIHDARGDLLDRAIVIWLPGPATYTGEDVAEFHLHGGRAVLDGVADALLEFGLRLAEPGEFSRRAFYNGRLDLVQAEAISDLVAAETAGQRRQALRQMEGALGRLYEVWADRLTRVLAHQEALIDFPDENLPPAVEAALTAEVASIAAEVATHLSDGRRGEKMREGLVFVVQGPPNVGKSTLVNALAERDVAIVSPHAGTTRDTLEVSIVLGDVPVTLIDTAGLRDTDDPVEAEGVRRARAKAETADLVLRLISAQPMVDDAASNGWLAGKGLIKGGCEPPELLIGTKTDLAPHSADVDISVSARTGAGMSELRHRLATIAAEATGQSGPPPLTRQRHRALLSETRNLLHTAHLEAEPELRAESLRLALAALGGITGKVGVEALLDRVFGDFCIGK
ncbi:tRNA uridine-5-carboxymethylaminomethyl(34) synthesis GTPase MnmE [Acidisoma sp.]|uniref:tRNA uridine-5-carboxymethylaminomethyl(34) synthesis GTPase MnmE n=1 Tax=Acidisoma sp. TaxID=1872115 RepID=UPI003B00191D